MGDIAVEDKEYLQEIFAQMEKHLLEDSRPSVYFNAMQGLECNTFPFSMLFKLKSIEQSPKHHPEGNVWNHTMLVIDYAAGVKEQSSDSRVFMWAALLHDIGKAETTKIRKGKITSYDHDKVGAELAAKFLEPFVDDRDFITKVSALVRWHMQILFVVNDLPFQNIEKMKQQTNVQDIALFGMCDRMGRTMANQEQEQENIRIFLAKCLL
jgi:uncharacterized domain HDIG